MESIAAAPWSPGRDTPEGRSRRGFVRVAKARCERLEPVAPAEKCFSATARARRFRHLRRRTKRGLRSGQALRRSLARLRRSSRRRPQEGSQTARRYPQRLRLFPPGLEPPWRSALDGGAPSGGTAAIKRNADRLPPSPPFGLRGGGRGASPPQCRLGWRSLDKNTSRASGGRAPCLPIQSRVRAFPRIRCTHTNRRPCVRSKAELPSSRRPRPFSSNSNAHATPGPRSAKSIRAGCAVISPSNS